MSIPGSTSSDSADTPLPNHVHSVKGYKVQRDFRPIPSTNMDDRERPAEGDGEHTPGHEHCADQSNAPNQEKTSR